MKEKINVLGSFFSDKFGLFQVCKFFLSFVFRLVVVTRDPFFNKLFNVRNLKMFNFGLYVPICFIARLDLEVALFGIFLYENQELRVLKCEETRLKT